VLTTPRRLIERNLVDEKVLRAKPNGPAHAGYIAGEVTRRSDV